MGEEVGSRQEWKGKRGEGGEEEKGEREEERKENEWRGKDREVIEEGGRERRQSKGEGRKGRWHERAEAYI